MDRDDAIEWIEAGFPPSEASEWAAIGCDDPDEATDLKNANLSLEEAERWLSLGLLPGNVSSSVESGLTIDVAQKWPKCILIEDPIVWIDLGFGSDDELGPFAGRVTLADLRSAGIAVDHESISAAIRRFGPYLSVGVQSLKDAVGWFDQEIEADDVKPWLTSILRSEPSVVLRWVSAGFTSPEAVTLWMEKGWLAEEAATWMSAGFTPAEALRWRTAGIDHLTARRRADAGLVPPAN